MDRSYRMISLLLATAILCGCAKKKEDTDVQGFVTSHVEKIEPLEKDAALASWEAAITGDPNHYDRSSELTLQIRRIYSDPNDYAYLKSLKESGSTR